ncbi:MAG: hypothetical protein COT91_00250 [Candidatus Doudnabacteria bacterium CG10_big_fil_rev_8_21_14_0_10_41_10]|uniref:BFN domain-containing protein n=1 Tax=Candidatus Doudnabacteria bacterium CG10_big_fil_rev_8_21_14_0_10_41_10 TaxID=1974551 RepID=A0A2H0VEW2_9BACT|nr:MAG: hypothetical protein COT91_00250 [Candidatus Doudnabacteria bacterium CG10_big_fil_rev_8_21_14_0_10_41_10]
MEIRVDVKMEDLVFFNIPFFRQFFVIVREISGSKRALPILTSELGFLNISQALIGQTTSRPTTLDTFVRLVEALGYQFDKGVVTRLDTGAYLGRLFLSKSQGDGGEIWVDCGPSGTIAICVKQNAPLFVGEELLEQASNDEAYKRIVEMVERTKGLGDDCSYSA